MKMRRRIRALEDLLAQLGSKDFDTREFALFQLGLILDRSNLAEGDELATRNLSREHLRLRLPRDAQALVAEQLSQLALRSKESRASALWTMGKVDGAALFGQLLALISAFGKQLKDEEAYQACRALNKCLETGDDFSHSNRKSLRDGNLGTILERWRLGSDKRLQLTASKAIAAIEGLDD